VVAIVEAFPQAKDFAIDVLVWCNLNHRRTVRRPNMAAHVGGANLNWALVWNVRTWPAIHAAVRGRNGVGSPNCDCWMNDPAQIFRLGSRARLLIDRLSHMI